MLQSCLPRIEVLIELLLVQPGAVCFAARIKSPVEVRLTAPTDGSTSFPLSRFTRFFQLRNYTRLTHLHAPRRRDVKPRPDTLLRLFSPAVAVFASHPITPLMERGSGKLPRFVQY